MSDRIPWVVKLAIAFAALLVCVVASVLLLAMAPPARENRLQELLGKMPEPGLSLVARKQASDYGTGWMKVVEVLGSSGIGNKAHVEQAYRTELLPLVESFENGSPSERHAFAACRMLHEAVVYAGANGDPSYRWPDPALNRLLRLERVPDSLFEGRVVLHGIGELLFDYQQIVDPASFNLAYRLNQVREGVK